MSGNDMMRRARLVFRAPLVAGLVLTLMACGHTKRVEQDIEIKQSTVIGLPAEFKTVPKEGVKTNWVGAAWWQQMNHPTLDAWVTSAIANNADLRVALSRIAQANAQLGIVGAGRVPTVYAGLNASQTSGGAQAMNLLGTRSGATRDQLNLQMSYEFDFWGRREFSIESAYQQVRSAEYGRDSFQVSMIAEVAATYFRSVALKERLSINQRMIVMAHRNTADIRRKLAMGEATQVMLSQQLIFEQSLQAQARDLEQQLQQVLGQLSYLTGKFSKETPEVPDHLGEVLLPAPASFKPSELLCRRPDLMQAEADLLAANADVSVARAYVLPSVSVSLLAGQVAAGMSGLMAGTNALIQGGLSVSQSVFDGGARRQGVALSEARRNELMSRYVGAVSSALRDTEVALSGVQLSNQKLTWLIDNRKQAQTLAEQMRIMMERGGLDFAQLIQIQTAVYNSEDAAVSGYLERILSQIELYKAIGGGLESKTTQCIDVERNR